MAVTRGEHADLQKTISTFLTGAASTRRQMIDKARTTLERAYGKPHPRRRLKTQ